MKNKWFAESRSCIWLTICLVASDFIPSPTTTKIPMGNLALWISRCYYAVSMIWKEKILTCKTDTISLNEFSTLPKFATFSHHFCFISCGRIQTLWLLKAKDESKHQREKQENCLYYSGWCIDFWGNAKG